jgi:hypothetical protein
MDYTILRKSNVSIVKSNVRYIRFRPAASRFGHYRTLVWRNSSVNRAGQLEGARTKTPCITMGFCFLGGNILVSEVQSQRAVMPRD